jgi:predicted AAA+ superfamily ATPase
MGREISVYDYSPHREQGNRVAAHRQTLVVRPPTPRNHACQEKPCAAPTSPGKVRKDPALRHHEILALTARISWYIMVFMIDRQTDIGLVRRALRRSRVVAVLGPRQCGKTTLARQFVPADSLNYFDLEDPQSVARLAEPDTALRPLRGLVVIDEIQRRPELFPLLRVLADRKPSPARFLILGSAAPDRLSQSSESLAGRLETVLLEGFRLRDLGVKAQSRLWLRGGFPLAYTAKSEGDSLAWRRQFLQTFLERDLPQLGIRIPAVALGRFWNMLAHYHAQIWNGAELARALAVSESTVRRYLDLLTGVFMIRQLPPWFENLGKRQVKAPKVFVRDSGLLHALLGIGSQRDLENHPKVGASWEGYAVEEVIKALRPDESYYWATHQGAEIDLLLFKHGRRIGVECKRMDAPGLTPSMRIAMKDVRLDRLVVVYPGTRRYTLAERVEVIPLLELVAGKENGERLFTKR